MEELGTVSSLEDIYTIMAIAQVQIITENREQCAPEERGQGP